MIELSLHILDIVENSVKANANLIQISINENFIKNKYIIDIQDNGYGMLKKVKNKVIGSFFTSKTSKIHKIGLGLALLIAAVKRTGGNFHFFSKLNKGTLIKAELILNHIDRQPLGKIVSTLLTLILGYPEIDFIYKHKCKNKLYLLNTKIIKNQLNGIPINNLDVLFFLRFYIQKGLKSIEAEFLKEEDF